jgi:hypothetical protein
MLDALKLPADTPKVRNCFSCGRPMYIVQVNAYFAFWVHKPEDQEACGKCNPHIKGVPFIRTSQPYFEQIMNSKYGKLPKVNVECLSQQ